MRAPGIVGAQGQAGAWGPGRAGDGLGGALQQAPAARAAAVPPLLPAPAAPPPLPPPPPPLLRLLRRRRRWRHLLATHLQGRGDGGIHVRVLGGGGVEHLHRELPALHRRTNKQHRFAGIQTARFQKRPRGTARGTGRRRTRVGWPQRGHAAGGGSPPPAYPGPAGLQPSPTNTLRHRHALPRAQPARIAPGTCTSEGKQPPTCTYAALAPRK